MPDTRRYKTPRGFDDLIMASDGEAWISMECRNADGTPSVRLLDEDIKVPMPTVCMPYRDLKEAISVLPKGVPVKITFSEHNDKRKMDVEYGDCGHFSLPYDAAPVPSPWLPLLRKLKLLEMQQPR